VLIALLAAAPVSALDEVIWEKTDGWADAGFTYFSGSSCDVSGGGLCRREMGWQGNNLTFTFVSPADVGTTADLVFEFAVDLVARTVDVSFSAGAAGSSLADAGTLRIDRPGLHRASMSSALFVADGNNAIRLRGDNPVGFGQPSGFRWLTAALERSYSSPPDVSPEELLDDTQRRAYRYFYEQSYANGLCGIRWGRRSPAWRRSVSAPP